MNQREIRELEKDLWASADDLRANSKLTAAEYKDPLLGLILLRFAQNRYEDAKEIVEANLPINPRTKEKRTATKNDYIAAGAILLPDKAKYDYLADLSESTDLAEEINNAMTLIEEEYTDLVGILPKNYQEFDKRLLQNLVRLFNQDAIKNAKGDVFGRIYEFFLMKFSMQGAGAQEGGEFFTPPALVNLIVNFIQPNHGIVHDPACGSGGMFVQTAHFIKSHENKRVNEAIKVYGTELKNNNTKLAKMNLAIHGIEGEISENNSFYIDPYKLVGKCDFVMANPPFNVDKVNPNDYVKEDVRLPFKAPLTGKGTIGNGNYLWIQYFLSYLNEKGRAGFVMASSATDAGNAEKRIRQQLIETGAVECIVSISNNFFYTRSLPCHLWFYNKGKSEAKQDKILMIDARNTFRTVNTTLNDFSEGQQLNLTTIMEMFRGSEQDTEKALAQHLSNCQDWLTQIEEVYAKYYLEMKTLLEENNWEEEIHLIEKIKLESTILEGITEEKDLLQNAFRDAKDHIDYCQRQIERIQEEGKKQKWEKRHINDQLKPYREKVSKLKKPIGLYEEKTAEFFKELNQAIKDWQALLEYFPEGVYQDVEGLCKIVEKAEVEEQDYSLTPGRYVGVKIEIDMDFDYQGRILEINTELAQLNTEANELMEQIQAVEL